MDRDSSERWDVGAYGAKAVTSQSGPIIVQERAIAVSGLDADLDGRGFNLMDYWRAMMKHRLAIISAFVLTVAFGIALTLLTTPTYNATTTLQIDRDVGKIVNVEGVNPSEMLGGEEFFQTQYGLLRSRSLAMRVVDNLNLAGDDTFLTEMDALPRGQGGRAPTRAQRREAAINVVSKNLRVDPVRGSRLVRVTFESPSAPLSARLANAFGENFIAANIERRFQASTYARDFLEDRIAQVKTKLEESEKQLVAYAAQQQIINVPSAGGSDGDGSSGSQSLTASDLVSLNNSLSQAKSERIRAEQKWRQAQSTPTLGLADVLQSPSVQSLTQSRAALEATYQEKLSVYRPDFPSMTQLRAQITELDKQIANEARNIREALRSQYLISASQERALAGQVENLKSSVLDLRSRSIQYTILQREVDTNRTQYDTLLQRYKELSVAGTVGANNVSVVDRAEPPTRPSKPRPLVNLVLSAVLGLLIGVGLAVLLEALDESIKAPDDVETKLGLPLLGTVPVLDKGVRPPEAMADLRSGFSEAYNSIRTMLQFSTDSGVPETLLIASTRPSEGKTTTAVAIAQSFARLGKRVLLVDGDLRNPSVHRVLSMDNAKGLSGILTGSLELEDVVMASNEPNLSLIVCGPLPLNPAELLAGGRLRAFLAKASSLYEIVIVDGPPVMGLADSPLLADAVKGTVLVVEAAGTRRGPARSAIRRLQAGRARIVGVVLTKFSIAKTGYGENYSYAYAYEYGPSRVTDR